MWSETRAVAIAGGTAALLLGLVGCSSSTQVSTSSAGSSASASASTSSANAGGAPEHAATVDGVLSDFVAAIVDGDYPRACLDMAAPASGATNGPLKPATAQQCAATTTTAAGSVSPLAALRDLHESFTPKNATGHAVVSVTGGDTSGSKVTINANQIVVDGQSLVQVVLSHSTGLTAAKVDIGFVMSAISGAWYVSDMNINI